MYKVSLVTRNKVTRRINIHYNRNILPSCTLITSLNRLRKYVGAYRYNKYMIYFFFQELLEINELIHNTQDHYVV